MKQLLLLLALLCSGLFAMAQTQQGYVKTKGRFLNSGQIVAGQRLPGTLIQIKNRNAITSGTNGAFTFPVKGGQYILTALKKKGYVPVDPDQLLRAYVYSTNPLVLVMESPETQYEDQLNAMQIINRNLRRTLQEKEAELEKLRESGKISEEKYQQELQECYNRQRTNAKLVEQMADEFAKLDFDQLDERNKLIKTFILEGQFAKADSLINIKGNLNDRVANYQRHKEANNQEEKELADRLSELEKSRQMEQLSLTALAEDCMSKHQLFKLQHQNDSAAYYIDLRVQLDTTNVEWLLEAGLYADQFLADYKKAKEYCTRALNILSKNNKDNSLAAAIAYNNLGTIYERMGKYNEAIETLQKSLKLRESILGKKHRAVATALANIATIQTKLSKFNEALALHQQALEIRKKCYGEQSDSLVLSYIHLGSTYDEMDNIPAAMSHFQKAQEILSNNNSNDKKLFLNLYTNMSSLYKKEAKYQEALDFAEKALQYCIEVYGDTHPLTAVCYNNLAVDYSNGGRRKEALLSYEKALAIQRQIFGQQSGEVSGTLLNMGMLFYKESNLTKARDYTKQALDIALNCYGKKHKVTALAYNNLAGIYDELGEYDNARTYYEAALEIQLAILGENSLNAATAYSNLAACYTRQGNLSLGLNYSEKALGVTTEILGTDHPSVAVIYHTISEIYRRSGKTEEALDYKFKALNIFVRKKGETSLNSIIMYKSIGTLYYQTDSMEQARAYFRKAIECSEKAYGKEHAITLEMIDELIVTHLNKGLYAEALPYLEEYNTYIGKVKGYGSKEALKGAMNLYFTYNALSAENPDYIAKMQKMQQTHIFVMAIKPGDTPAAQAGMSGTYLLLSFGDWDLRSDNLFININAAFAGKPKDIVVMKNNEITKYHFEDKIGCDYLLMNTGEDGKAQYIEAYEQWLSGK